VQSIPDFREIFNFHWSNYSSIYKTLFV